ncbi:MAG: hypothetical protein H6735_11130 [Alphaproteobacteria bacterium]|nr:hypothetical protein [Alphaproteobacteria bacterium]
MHEDHQREQYFFDPPTVARLADLLEVYDRPCCLCAPTVARALADRGRAVTLLEVDERFASVPGFRRWDLYRPTPLAQTFDAILVDPPFWKVTLSQLFTALRVLARGDLTLPTWVCHLASREADVCGTLAPFGLGPTEIEPGYVSVRPIEANRVRLYSNVTAGGGGTPC